MRRDCVIRGAERDLDAVERSMTVLPSAMFVLTAAYEDERGGFPVAWVMQASAEPPCLAVAIAKGHPTVPLIRDSRAFAICQLGAADRRTFRRFQIATRVGHDDARPDRPPDPFDALPIEVGVTGSPLLRGVEAVFDCRVTCHVDFDADHELYIGEVVDVR